MDFNIVEVVAQSAFEKLMRVPSVVEDAYVVESPRHQLPGGPVDGLLAEIRMAGKGRGPPPPPPTPEMVTRAEAKLAAGPTSQEWLGDIRKLAVAKAEKRSRGIMVGLKAELAKVFTGSALSIEQAFREFDVNGDGAIDHGEFRDGLRALGAQVTMGQLEDMITMLDVDGDGEIDYHEFARWFGRGPPPVRGAWLCSVAG